MSFFAILVSASVMFGISELPHLKITPAKVADLSITGQHRSNVTDAGYFFMKKIKLYSKKYGLHYALVDDEDYELVNKHKWNLFKGNRHKTFYAHAAIFINGKHTTLRMHRLVMGLIHGKPIVDHVDHIDHNGLNNQKNNLRFCNQSQNSGNSKLCILNTSGYKGVSFATNNKNWVARIGFQNKRIFIGAFSNKIDAAKAYNQAAIKYFGEFARLNKIPNE